MIGCFKINSIFLSTVLYFLLGTSWKTCFELSRVKLYRKWHEGIWKLVQVSGRFELLRVRVTKGKITVNLWTKSTGNWCWFELARVRVSEGSSYRDSTVIRHSFSGAPSPKKNPGCSPALALFSQENKCHLKELSLFVYSVYSWNEHNYETI